MDKLVALLPLLLILACPLGMALIGLAGWGMARKRKGASVDMTATVHQDTTTAGQPLNTYPTAEARGVDTQRTISARP